MCACLLPSHAVSVTANCKPENNEETDLDQMEILEATSPLSVSCVFSCRMVSKVPDGGVR